MTDLIARLKAAEEGSRELDKEVFCAEYGWSMPLIGASLQEFEALGRKHEGGNRYTTSIDAAMTLVPTECDYRRYVDDSSGTGWKLGRFDPLMRYIQMGEGYADGLPAIALCIAALRARLATQASEEVK